jgi:hypothetical protein
MVEVRLLTASNAEHEKADTTEHPKDDDQQKENRPAACITTTHHHGCPAGRASEKWDEVHESIKLNVRTIDFPVKANSVNRHDDRTNGTNNAEARDRGRRLRRKTKGPRREKQKEQGAHCHENDMEAFDRHIYGSMTLD